MKRSEINNLIDEAIKFFNSHQLHLPPWATWTAAHWKKAGIEADEIRKHGLGWMVTDFGSGDFYKSGLLLFVIRNGLLENGVPQTTKTYAEKAMMVRPNQITPWHFHWQKTEDLINRGGGKLEVELGWASDDEKGISEKEVLVQLDGITVRLPPRGKLILGPGESVTLPPMLCHQFRGEAGNNCICVGEVSCLNDDFTDNCFIYGIKERHIEEDVEPKYWMWTEYPKSVTAVSH